MSRLEELCVFLATIELIKERGMTDLIQTSYLNCKREMEKPKDEMRN